MFTMYRSFLEIFLSFTTLYMSVTDPKLQCPSHYPAGCLLGCVDLTDCLAQDEYREKVGTAYHAPDGNLFSCQFIHLHPPPPSLNVEKRRQIREKERNLKKSSILSLFMEY